MADDIRRVVISGCSGGGKSTVLAELARRGFATVEEPGRRIVRDEQASGGRALPWIDPAAFLRRAVDMALADLQAVDQAAGWVFFDRGLIDAASALQHVTGEPALEAFAGVRFHRAVFMVPPWPEIYQTDAERRHTLAEALPEFERLARDYPELGYQVIQLPKLGVAERADFILETLAAWKPSRLEMKTPPR